MRSLTIPLLLLAFLPGVHSLENARHQLDIGSNEMFKDKDTDLKEAAGPTLLQGEADEADEADEAKKMFMKGYNEGFFDYTWVDNADNKKFSNSHKAYGKDKKKKFKMYSKSAYKYIMYEDKNEMKMEYIKFSGWRAGYDDNMRKMDMEMGGGEKAKDAAWAAWKKLRIRDDIVEGVRVLVLEEKKELTTKKKTTLTQLADALGNEKELTTETETTLTQLNKELETLNKNKDKGNETIIAVIEIIEVALSLKHSTL